jgi:hypothetical protein
MIDRFRPEGAMSKANQQCPFLDGADQRCSNCLRLEHLNHAFKFCFGRFKACPTYLQLQVEGRMRSIERAARDGENEFRGKKRFGEFQVADADARGRAAASAVALASCD